MVSRCLLVFMLGCGARAELLCGDEDCSPPPTETSRDEECSGELAPAPPCDDRGLVFSLPDECLDDGGNTDVGDVLEVYCIDGQARFCLSHESCPWRDGSIDSASCSRGGLASTYMANTINECSGWLDHELYCCSMDGEIGLR